MSKDVKLTRNQAKEMAENLATKFTNSGAVKVNKDGSVTFAEDILAQGLPEDLTEAQLNYADACLSAIAGGVALAVGQQGAKVFKENKDLTEVSGVVELTPAHRYTITQVREKTFNATLGEGNGEPTVRNGYLTIHDKHTPLVNRKFIQSKVDDAWAEINS